MELRRIDPGDAAAVASYVEVTNEVRDVDSPWEHRMTQAEGAGLLRFGWDLEPAVGFLAVVDGEVVGLAEYSTSTLGQPPPRLAVGVGPSAGPPARPRQRAASS